mmetsp:Transcript_86745/g.243010  ORF Transcript_86745/g.243010 Transcript_86745/m.243010 type:complete len:276 (-) Transcript_86745:1315-2142(-)
MRQPRHDALGVHVRVTFQALRIRVQPQHAKRNLELLVFLPALEFVVGEQRQAEDAGEVRELFQCKLAGELDGAVLFGLEEEHQGPTVNASSLVRCRRLCIAVDTEFAGLPASEDGAKERVAAEFSRGRPEARVPRVFHMSSSKEPNDRCVERGRDPVKCFLVRDLVDRGQQVLVAIDLDLLCVPSPWYDVGLSRLVLFEDPQVALVVASHVVLATKEFLLADINDSEDNGADEVVVLGDPSRLREMPVFFDALVAPRQPERCDDHRVVSRQSQEG